MYRVWTNKSGLKPPRFIEVPMLIQVNERLCICVLKVSSLPLCKVFLLNLGNVPTLWYLLSGFGNKKNEHYVLQTNICKSSHFFGKQQKQNKYKDNEMHVPMPKHEIRSVIIILQHSVAVFNSLLEG
jgi:hypothetical protein